MQVDYATDETWTTWCQNALRQLLERTAHTTNNGPSSVSTLGNIEIHVPGYTNRSIAETWSHQRHSQPLFVTPASRHTTEGRVERNRVLGDVPQTVEPEVNMWDYNMMVRKQHGRAVTTYMTFTTNLEGNELV